MQIKSKRFNKFALLFILRMAIKNIIFDLGGVIYDINYQNTISAFQDLGVSDPKSFYSQAEQVDLFDKYETGHLDTEGFIAALKRELPKGVTDDEIILAWNAMLSGIPEHRLTFLEEVIEEYNIFLLSNTNPLHIQQLNDEMNKFGYGEFPSYFHTAYYSFELGMRKPHVEIFQEVLEREGLDPEETLFIDDSAQHIKGAKKAGLHTYHHVEGDITEVLDEVIQSL